MKLDSATWRTLSELLDRALDMDEPTRAAWLETLDGEHAAMMPLVRAMLARRGGPETGDFIDTLPPFDIVAAAATAFKPGTIVGAYRLVRELGRDCGAEPR